MGRIIFLLYADSFFQLKCSYDTLIFDGTVWFKFVVLLVSVIVQNLNIVLINKIFIVKIHTSINKMFILDTFTWMFILV